jgi:hypothetical protein
MPEYERVLFVEEDAYCGLGTERRSYKTET